jgi:hypothetical protein
MNPTIQNHVELLYLLDKLKCYLSTKNGEFNILYEKICICSYLNPLEYVKRINKIIHCTHDKTTNTFNTEKMKEEDFYNPNEETI